MPTGPFPVVYHGDGVLGSSSGSSSSSSRRDDPAARTFYLLCAAFSSATIDQRRLVRHPGPASSSSPASSFLRLHADAAFLLRFVLTLPPARRAADSRLSGAFPSSSGRFFQRRSDVLPSSGRPSRSSASKKYVPYLRIYFLILCITASFSSSVITGPRSGERRDPDQVGGPGPCGRARSVPPALRGAAGARPGPAPRRRGPPAPCSSSCRSPWPSPF